MINRRTIKVHQYRLWEEEAVHGLDPVIRLVLVTIKKPKQHDFLRTMMCLSRRIMMQFPAMKWTHLNAFEFRPAIPTEHNQEIPGLLTTLCLLLVPDHRNQALITVICSRIPQADCPSKLISKQVIRASSDDRVALLSLRGWDASCLQMIWTGLDKKIRSSLLSASNNPQHYAIWQVAAEFHLGIPSRAHHLLALCTLERCCLAIGPV